MKIAIGCIARFDVTVTREIIDVLTALGRTHYDGVCKAAVNHGGFIYGWDQRMQFQEQDGEEPSFVDSITNRELQTCLKICEGAHSLLTDIDELNLVGKLCAFGTAALRQANEDPRFASTVPVVPGAKPSCDTRDVQIERLRAENARLYSQAVALFHFVPGDARCGDIQEIRGRYEAWINSQARK